MLKQKLLNFLLRERNIDLLFHIHWLHSLVASCIFSDQGAKPHLAYWDGALINRVIQSGLETNTFENRSFRITPYLSILCMLPSSF